MLLSVVAAQCVHSAGGENATNRMFQTINWGQG